MSINTINMKSRFLAVPDVFLTVLVDTNLLKCWFSSTVTFAAVLL